MGLCRAEADVMSMAIFGSVLRPQDLDDWSDIDVLIVVRDNALQRFFPSTAWLEPVGRIFAREHFSGDTASTTRVCFEDLRRLDLTIATESSALRIATWPQVAFADGLHVLFSRSAEVSACLAGPFKKSGHTLPSTEQVETLIDAFWFRALVAVAKVARDDLVIALHLTLSLYQDCCVLTMMLRDRDTGTNQHRTGGMANDVVATFADTERPPTPLGILDLIEATGRILDRLAASWSDGCQPGLPILQPAIDLARKQVSGS